MPKVMHPSSTGLCDEPLGFEPYVMLSREAMEKVLKVIGECPEPMTTLRIFLKVISLLDPDHGSAAAGRKKLSILLNMHVSRVSRCVTVLVREGVLKRDMQDANMLHVRPDIAWNGTVRARRDALQGWLPVVQNGP